MPIPEGGTNTRIRGGGLNPVTGGMTTNHVGSAKNANTGRNYGIINQDDNRGAIPQASRMYPPTANASQPGGGPGSSTHANRGIPQTINYIDSTKNFNAGDNHGTINQNDNHPAPIPVATVRASASHPAMSALPAPAPPLMEPSVTSPAKGSTNPSRAFNTLKKRR